MSAETVAMVLAPAGFFDLRVVPRGAPAWVALAAGMEETLAVATAEGFAVTELLPSGKSATAWFLNHLNTVDQHHNEFSQLPAYRHLMVFGVRPSGRVDAWLREFGFGPAVEEAYGLSATKRRYEPVPATTRHQA